MHRVFGALKDRVGHEDVAADLAHERTEPIIASVHRLAAGLRGGVWVGIVGIVDIRCGAKRGTRGTGAVDRGAVEALVGRTIDRDNNAVARTRIRVGNALEGETDNLIVEIVEPGHAGQAGRIGHEVGFGYGEERDAREIAGEVEIAYS